MSGFRESVGLLNTACSLGFVCALGFQHKRGRVVSRKQSITAGSHASAVRRNWIFVTSSRVTDRFDDELTDQDSHDSFAAMSSLRTRSNTPLQDPDSPPGDVCRIDYCVASCVSHIQSVQAKSQHFPLHEHVRLLVRSSNYNDI